MKFAPKVFSDWSKSEDYPKFNWEVSIHVDSFNFADTTPYKVFLQMEPPMIRPGVEQEIIRHKGFYDLILAWTPEVLSYCGNAVLFPFGCSWTHEPDTSQKKYQTSFLISSKTMCEGHHHRQNVFARTPAEVDGMKIVKHQSPPMLPDKRSMLVPFQYSIIMENARMTNFFTEKLVDCLATKTIPIYWGCLNVGDFFNPAGIMKFENYEEMVSQIHTAIPGYYEDHKDVIEENYKTAMTYANLGERVHRAVTDVWLHPEKIGKWRIG